MPGRGVVVGLALALGLGWVKVVVVMRRWSTGRSTKEVWMWLSR